ncbi:MAG TPA: T9SS type A sorting domain-containing protein, partial [Bacteroidales bacterium]|nr:T9SS type A sorting domain-containing protein [Bacteroidales bacterium]
MAIFPQVCPLGANIDDMITNKDEQLLIFPNPTNGNIVIVCPESLSSNKIDNANITVYNLLGEIVLTKRVETNNKIINIDISNQKSGIYFININSNHLNIIRKILLNK